MGVITACASSKIPALDLAESFTIFLTLTDDY
jgi:hypothetical protein